MDRTMHFGPGLARVLACVTLAVLALTGPLSLRTARAQTNPMATAQQQYDAAQFAEALATLQAALETGAVTGTDAVAARELLARCQVKTGNAAAAKRTFLLILRQDPQYRLDEVRTPPDEVAVFQTALSAFTAEQLHSQQRIPASLSTSFGLGSGANEDIGEYVALGGGDKSFDNKPMFGIGVRFPIASKWSLDLELIRFRATNEDSVSGAAQAKYEITATPLVVNLVYLARESGKLRLNVFAGAGPMLNSYASDQFLFFSAITLKVTDTKVGRYFHGGLEGEYAVHPRLSVTGRALLRSAVADDVFGNSTFTQYTSGQLGNRKIDFSGYGVSLGLRGYIGY